MHHQCAHAADERARLRQGLQVRARLPEHQVEQQHLPDKLKDRRYYQPAASAREEEV
jgi:replication-associated recombination protein RarA